MRLPMTEENLVDREKAIPMIHRAFEAGINYIDSAVGYCNHDSQRAVGDALKGWRDKIVVSTKNHHYDKADDKGWWTNLEDSLECLQVEYIDVYNFHGNTWNRFTQDVDGPDGVYRHMLKAKDQGLIRHISCSFHDNCEALIKIVDTGMFDSITCQYSLLDRDREDGIAHAHEKNVGIVVMGPVGGGRLGETGGEFAASLPAGVTSTPELALRFVMANPNVSIALSGMSTMQHVEENIATANREESLSDDERTAIAGAVEQLKEMSDLYCTGCGYCQPCEQGVAIADIFRQRNLYQVYDAKSAAREKYAQMIQRDRENKKPATACVECGECEPKCPQDIKIMEQLKEAHELLTSTD